MQNAARIQASIEILTECETSWRTPHPLPADILMNRYFKKRRYIGSKDRGAIAELTYFIIRNRAALTWWTNKHDVHDARALMIATLLLEHHRSIPDLHNVFNGERFMPHKLFSEEVKFANALVGKTLMQPDMPDAARYNYPDWLDYQLKASLGSEWKSEMEALNQEAPVDLRANTLLVSRDDLCAALQKEGYDVAPTPHSAVGIRMQKRAPIFTSEHFKKGWFEMQDEGSQLVTSLLQAKAGEKVVDFCAGAGGKTLSLAASMQNKGRILAWDTSKNRLEQMTPRIKRAKVDNVQRHLLTSENDAFIKRHKDSVDAVLIDAPCSGTGTWRRNPDSKWRFTYKDLQEIIDIQARILVSASRLVKKDGRLLYVTCSLLENENESQIQNFIEHNKNFRVVIVNKMWNNFSQQETTHENSQGGTIRLTPLQDGTDGFFACLLKRVA